MFRHSSDKNNYLPMTKNEQRPFEIDVTEKPNCGLTGPGNIVHIIIEKANTQLNPVEHRFSMVGHKFTVYIVCRAGYIPDLTVVGDAEECGIGKILVQLCLNEDKMHKASKHNKNIAMLELKRELELCNVQQSCNDPDIRQLMKLKKRVKSSCSKVLLLIMSTSRYGAAHVYFKQCFVFRFHRYVYQNQ